MRIIIWSFLRGLVSPTFIKSKLSPCFYKIWLTQQTVALFKYREKMDMGPFGLMNILVKVLHREVIQPSKTELR